jgi:hypothetical protein
VCVDPPLALSRVDCDEAVRFSPVGVFMPLDDNVDDDEDAFFPL